MSLGHRVPLISQKSIRLCWEACGHMLWNWHYNNDKNTRAKYEVRAGNYVNMDRGLSIEEMDHFCKLLGLRSLGPPKGANIIYALKWSPVIATSVDQVAGHAMVIDGYHGPDYMIINPCAQMAVSFDTENSDSCTVGRTRMERTELDGKLGKLIWYW